MPDITMCKGSNCSLRESCYRFTAKANSYQSYFTEPPVIKSKEDNKPDECEYFWKNKSIKKNESK